MILLLLLLLFLETFPIFLQASSQVGSFFLLIIQINFLLIPYEHLDSSLPSLMSMAPMWFSDGVDSFSSFNNIASPPKDCRMIIKAKRCLPSNRLPPPSSSSFYPDQEQTSFGVGRGDEAAVVQTHQKKSRNFSCNNTDSNLLDNYASQMAQNILDLVKQELCKICVLIFVNTRNLQNIIS
jgi:hypothetical protein